MIPEKVRCAWLFEQLTNTVAEISKVDTQIIMKAVKLIIEFIKISIARIAFRFDILNEIQGLAKNNPLLNPV